MKLQKLSAVLIFVIAAFYFAQSKENPPENDQTISKGKIVDGTITSIDIEHNMFVMKTKITKVDTLHLDKSAIIKAGHVVAGRKDLKPDNHVKANYEMKKGKKVATRVLTYPEGSFLPDTSDLGKNVLIAEGTIHSINENGTMMVLKAPLEKEYIFSLDPDAVIKSGLKHVPLKDLQPNYEIRVIY
jgi:hypothetical protein